MFLKFRRHVLHPVMHRCRFNVICLVPFIIVFIYSYSSLTEYSYSKSDQDHIVAGASETTSSEKGVIPVQPMSEEDGDFVSAVLVMSARRDKALKNHLEQVVRLRPSSKKFPIIISQDGSNPSVSGVASHFVNNYRNVSYMHHKGDDEPRLLSRNYAYIAEHYKWALDKLFNETKYDFVIITEDDLDIASDFFSYFEWGKQILVLDTTVWCVSAWNDNGLPSLVNKSATAKIWRTDFFPGLGWMLTRKLWKELSPKFPKIYWDDWMRTDEVRRNRSCLRPEISRTAHNMKLAGKGTSGGLYKSFLSNIAVSSTSVDFTQLPYENMIKINYDRELQQTLHESKLIPFADFDTANFDPSFSYRVTFSTIREWFTLSERLGIMVDIRGGMQRTAYHGIVPLMFRSCRLFLVPSRLNMTDFETYRYDPLHDLQLRYLEFAKVFCNPRMYTGVCDPNSPELKAWFIKKKWLKRLESYKDMIMN